MFWTIVRKELVEHIGSFRFLTVFVLTILLMVTGVLVFSVQYERAIEEYPRRMKGLVDEEGKTHLRNVPCKAVSGVRRFPSDLAFCSGAGERELPNEAAIAVHGLRSLFRTSDIGELLGGSAYVDWAFAITVLLSFAAGLLTYKGISGELIY